MSGDDFEEPPPAELPIDGVLDLHAFNPADVADLVQDYLDECASRGITAIRIIHGKGKGTLRRTVHAVLERRSDVLEYKLAPGADSGVYLRGVPAARMQDRRTGVVETELRWNVTPRWALVGFVGTGHAGETASAWGVGFRRLMARRLGIYMGIDIARGPEETAIYIQAGSAWR